EQLNPLADASIARVTMRQRTYAFLVGGKANWLGKPRVCLQAPACCAISTDNTSNGKRRIGMQQGCIYAKLLSYRNSCDMPSKSRTESLCQRFGQITRGRLYRLPAGIRKVLH